MKKIILLLSFTMVSGFAIGQTAPIKKKNYVDEQRILNVEAATPRTGYISAPYRKDDGNWYEKTDAGVEQLIVDTVAMLATKYDLQNVSVDTVLEIATKYNIKDFVVNSDIIYPDSIISKIVNSDLNTNSLIKSINTDYNISSKYPIGYTPDSVFVIPFKSSKGYENLITQSNDFTSSPNWTYPGNPDAWSVKGGYNSPDGKNNGWKHISTNTPAFANLGTWARGVPVETGFDYIFSIYLKVGEGVSNDLTTVNFKCYTDATFYTTPVDNDALRPWVKYEIPFTSGNTSEAGNWMQFGVGGMDLGDSLYFSMPQIRRANTENFYVETNENGNVSDSTLFAIPLMENGVLNIDKVQRRDLNDSELMNLAIQFCHDSDDCNTITWSYDKTLTEPIELIEGVSIVGKRNGEFATSNYSYLQQEGIIYADLNDITKNLFNYNSLSIQGSPALIKDLTIVPISDFNIIFNTKTSLGIRLKNIDISTIDAAEFGNIGVYTEYSNGGGYENVNITDAVKIGFVFDGGNTGFVRDCRVSECDGGILNTSTNLNVLNFWGEGLDSFALRSLGTGNSILVDNSYFEAVPSNQDPNGKTFDISGANIFTLTNSLVLGSSIPLNTTFNPINLDSVNVANISNNRFGNSVNNLRTTVNTGNVYWGNNTESQVVVGDSLDMIYDIEKVTVINSTLQNSPETFTRNSIPRLSSQNALLEVSTIDTSNIVDGNFHSQILLNEPIVKSSSENLLLQSQVSNLGWSINGAQITQTQNVEVAPDGTTTGAKLEKLTNDNWFFRNSVTGHTMVVDEWYTFSTWIKVGDESYNNNMSAIEITIGASSEQIDATKPRVKYIQLDTITKDWERVFFTFQYSNTNNFIDIEVVGDIGDYVYLWGWDLERNKFLGGYEYTTTTIETGYPTLTLNDGLKLDGNVIVTDTLNLEGYGSGTVTGTPTKYLAVESDGDVIEVDGSSIGQLKYFTNIAVIPTTLELGERIKIESTGNEYFIQSDSVLYYTTDGLNVIDLTGKYAVIDLSTKRKFETLEELKKEIHFLDFKDKETVEVGKDVFELSYSYQRKYGSWLDAITNDTIVDGFFVDDVQMEFARNLVHYSEDLVNSFVNFPDGTYSPYILYNGNAGTFRQNEDIAPDGTRTAERITDFFSTATNQIQITGDKGEVEIGDSLTMSFYAKFNSTTGTNERLRAGAIQVAGAVPDFLMIGDGKWHRYEHTVVATSTSTANNSFYFGVFDGFANTDTLSLWGFQIEIAGSAGIYKKSNWHKGAKDRIYIYRKNIVKNGVLDLSNLQSITQLGASGSAWVNGHDDSNFLQSAIDYCAEGSRCNKIILGKQKYRITKKLKLRRGVKLIGGNNAYRTYGSNQPYQTTTTEIEIDLTNKNHYAIEMIPQGAQQVLDQSGISNIYFNAVDTIAGFLYTNEIASCEFSYISTGLTGDGHVDSCALHVATGASSDNHYNRFYKVAFGGGATTPYGLYYEGGSGNYFDNCNFSADTSIVIEEGVFNGNLISIETGNTGVFVKEGGEGNINGLYTEAAAYNGGATIRMEGGSLSLSNSTLQTNTTNDTLFNIIDAQNLSISDSRIINEGELFFGQSIESMSFNNVSSVSELVPYLNLSERLKGVTEVVGNHSTFNNVGESFKGETAISKSQNNFAKNSTFEGVIMSDSLFLSNVVLQGKRENLSNLSDSLGVDQTTAFISTFNNTQIAPDGTMTADLIVGLANTSSTYIQDKTLIENVLVGEPYTISVWLKGISSSNPSLNFTPRLGFNVTSGPSPSFIVTSNEWVRYEKTVFATVSNNIISVRVNNVVANDSIAVWGFQVNRGYHATSLINTTTTGIDNKDIIINTANDAKIDFTSPLTFSDYGSGTVTGTPAKYLAVESDGDVIEVDPAAGMDAVVSTRSYVDNAAALVDLVSGQVYYNTTSSTFVVLP